MVIFSMVNPVLVLDIMRQIRKECSESFQKQTLPSAVYLSEIFPKSVI